MKKTRHFPFSREKKTIEVEVFSACMIENKLKKCKPDEKLLMYQLVKKRILFHIIVIIFCHSSIGFFNLNITL